MRHRDDLFLGHCAGSTLYSHICDFAISILVLLILSSCSANSLGPFHTCWFWHQTLMLCISKMALVSETWNSFDGSGSLVFLQIQFPRSAISLGQCINALWNQFFWWWTQAKLMQIVNVFPKVGRGTHCKIILATFGNYFPKDPWSFQFVQIISQTHWTFGATHGPGQWPYPTNPFLSLEEMAVLCCA